MGRERDAALTPRVLVVGGGPAGLATAGALARAGVEATVCEAGEWPRPRLCGEFLSPDAGAALESVGWGDLVTRLGAPPIEALRVTVARRGRTVAESRAPLAAAGHGVSRIDLDEALAHAARDAGADVRERCRVESVASESGGVRARTADAAIEADAVVLATGRGGGVGRQQIAASREWIAVKTHVRGAGLVRATELHFVDGAYAGMNEVVCRGERVVNVCALARRSAWVRAGGAADGLWEMFARESPAFAERWRNADPVGGSQAAAAGFGFAVRGARGSGARPALFVGDAAALIAPLAGDGQAMALCGGVALGAIVAAHLRDGDPAGVRAASAAWRRAFAASFRGILVLRRALQAALLRPRSASALVRAASRFRPLTQWAYRATRGPLAAPR